MSTREFRLKTVLRARKRELDLARGQLASRLREQENEAQEQERLLARLEETSQALHARLSLGSPATILHAAGGAMDAARGGAEAAGRRAMACEAAIAEARGAVIESKRRLRGLEILEKRWLDREQKIRTKHWQLFPASVFLFASAT